MRKLTILLIIVIGITVVQADNCNYPYLVFETNDGNIHSVSVTLLKMTIADDSLVVANVEGSKTFALSKLNKMYFSTEGTSAINGVGNKSSLNNARIYDLQGRKVTRRQMHRGIYVVKSKDRASKIAVK